MPPFHRCAFLRFVVAAAYDYTPSTIANEAGVGKQTVWHWRQILQEAMADDLSDEAVDEFDAARTFAATSN